MMNIRSVLARRLSFLAWCALCACVLSQCLGGVWWFAELFSHFVPYYALIFILTAWCVSQRWRYLWAICGVLTSLWAWQPTFRQPEHTPNLTAIWYNVHLHNPQPAAEVQRMLAEHADIIALAEINFAQSDWQLLRQHYPYGCQHQEDSPFALVVWSKRKLLSCQVQFIQSYPYIRAQLNAHATLYAIHPPPPINAELAHNRQIYFNQLATQLAKEPTVLVMGDLNNSPYSPLFRDFIQRAQLHAHTRPILPTWRPLGLNIDHVFSHNAHDVAVNALDWGDSDHRALHIQWAY